MGGVLCVALFLRVAPTRLLVWLPPCPFHQATGLLCPGCGGTRAVLALLHGQVQTAWTLNPLIVALIPVAAAYLLTPAVLRRSPRLSGAFITTLCVLTLAFGILRNLAHTTL